MRKSSIARLCIAAGLALAALVFWLTRHDPPPRLPAAAQITGSPLAAELSAPGGTPARDLAVLGGLIAQFTTTYKPGQLPPLGDNEDITAALTGHNRQHVVFIPPDHPAIDAQGRLLDRWGSPYFFHARGAETIDLRSAGPDRTLFTPDDLTTAH